MLHAGQLSFLPSSPTLSSPVDHLTVTSDYIGYTYHHTEGSPYTPHIINYHSHIFAGLREKYAPLNSHRDSIWQKLQMLPRETLTEHLDQIYSQYLAPPVTPEEEQEVEEEEEIDHMVQ
jgi:hypothetical protein